MCMFAFWPLLLFGTLVVETQDGICNVVFHFIGQFRINLLCNDLGKIMPECVGVLCRPAYSCRTPNLSVDDSGCNIPQTDEAVLHTDDYFHVIFYISKSLRTLHGSAIIPATLWAALPSHNFGLLQRTFLPPSFIWR